MPVGGVRTVTDRQTSGVPLVDQSHGGVQAGCSWCRSTSASRPANAPMCPRFPRVIRPCPDTSSRGPWTVRWHGARAASSGAITQSGLTLADRVRTAPGAWRTRSETATGAGGVLAQWIRPDGVAGGDCEEPLADLHAPYTRWAQPVRSPALSERAFAGALRARGVRKVKRRDGNTWAGIGLPDHRPDKDD